MSNKLSEFVKSFIIAAAMLLAVSYAAGQKPAPPPKASDNLQVKILKVQKHMTDLQVQANALQKAMTDAGQDYAKSSKDLGDLVDGAYKEAGLSKNDWDFSLESFEFTKRASKIEDKK